MLDPLIHGPRLAYLGIVAAITLTGAGLPVPEEVFVIGAAIASSAGTLDPWVALVACMVGGLLGDSFMYFLGAHFGRGLLNDQRWFARILTPAAEAHVEQLIQRHGMKMFLVARFLVGLRTPFYVTTGILRIGYRRFLVLDLICACISIGTFFGLAYFLSEYYGEAIYRWIRDAEWFVTGLVALVAMAAGIYYYVIWRRRRGRGIAEPVDSFESMTECPTDLLATEKDNAPDELPRESDRLEHVA